MPKKVLITGAGGFIGGFLVEEALARGYEVWAAVRATTSRRYLTYSNIRFVELDFTQPGKLASDIRDAVRTNGKWDYVVHNLGATKCINFANFNTINYEYLKRLVEALRLADALPECLLLMSSLSVMGTGDESGETPFDARHIPMPNTRYGVSKLKAETFLQMQGDLPHIIFRPTGVYGPREHDYYLMIKSIARGFDFSVGFRRQWLTFIYVKDLARAVFDALESGVRQKAYILADDHAYSQKEFRDIVRKELGKRHVIPIKLPLWAVRIVCAIAEKIALIRMKPSTLNLDKFRIMKQRNWTCDSSAAKKDFGFTTRYDLQKGLHEAIVWYKDNSWL